MLLKYGGGFASRLLVELSPLHLPLPQMWKRSGRSRHPCPVQHSEPPFGNVLPVEAGVVHHWTSWLLSFIHHPTLWIGVNLWRGVYGILGPFKYKAKSESRSRIAFEERFLPELGSSLLSERGFNTPSRNWR